MLEYHIVFGNSVLSKVIQLEENEQLQKSIKEYKIVARVLQLVNEESKYIFENLYRQQKNKWDIIDSLHISEETYKRRKKALIYEVNKEIRAS